MDVTPSSDNTLITHIRPDNQLDHPDAPSPWLPIGVAAFLLYTCRDLTLETWLRFNLDILYYCPPYHTRLKKHLSEFKHPEWGGIALIALKQPSNIRVLESLLKLHLLSADAINATDKHNLSALLYAGIKGDVKTVRLLLQYGAVPRVEANILCHFQNETVIKTFLAAAPLNHMQWQELVDACFVTPGNWLLLAHFLENEPKREKWMVDTFPPIQNQWMCLYQLCKNTHTTIDPQVIDRVYKAIAKRARKETINQPFTTTTHTLGWDGDECKVRLHILPALCTLPPSAPVNLLVRHLLTSGADASLNLLPDESFSSQHPIIWMKKPMDAMACAEHSNHLAIQIALLNVIKPSPYPVSTVGFAAVSFVAACAAGALALSVM